ncbi:hypothetical protein DNG97_16485 [Vibrio parahaemolyticus]|nr:hypothetical protein [Vibrio parahaemolyticus]EHK2858357.1 hypothetical protein [Vibrio parahaemolyticus]
MGNCLTALYEKVVKIFEDFIDKLNPIVKTTITTFFKFIVNIVMSLLPLIIISLSEASKSNSEFLPIFSDKFFSEAMFLYCSAFIAPFFIISTSAIFFSGRKVIYPLILFFSFYVVIFGSLTYSGVFSRNIYQLGQSGLVYPTYSDLILLILTALVWIYCTFMEDYQPSNIAKKQRKDNAEKESKFEEAIS